MPMLDRAHDLLCDYLAVAARGSATGSGRAAQAYVRASAATGAAAVDGTGLTAPAELAALANGVAAHSIELDDTFEPGSLHPGVAVWPALLAVADELGSPLDDVLRAGIAGYDMACAVSLDPQECYARGFHPTGVCGPVGAAVAVARLLGLSEDAERNAVAIAASSASGLLEFLSDGTWTKRFHAGQAAASGIRAARLAAAGFTGPATALKGRDGFLHAFGGTAEALDEALAREPGWGVRSTAVKLYPCCRYMHGCIDLLLDIAPEAGDVASVRCGVLGGGWSLVADPPERKRRIRTDVDAQFSMPFGAALAIARRRATLADFEGATEFAGEAAELIGAVECFRSDALDAAYPARWGAEVEVVLRDGETIARRETDFRGSAERPASREMLREKASGLIGAERAAALFAAETIEALQRSRA